MLSYRDSAIKLFGTTISLQLKEGSPVQVVSVGSESSEEDEKTFELGSNLQSSEDCQSQNTTPEHKKQVAQSSDSQEDREAREPENLKPDSSVAEDVKAVNLTSEKHPENTSDSKLKILKKPDKILPCPRCKSMETKFCYYNNYNINQPRHFCKHCQRYWTAGGTMRNVPVGAGRRKSKSSASKFCQLVTYNPTAQSVNTKITESIPYSLNTNGSVLSFGSDAPHHISTASILNHAEKSIKRSDTSCPSTENAHSEDSKASCPQTSAVTACMNGVPWPYTYAQIASFSGPSFAIPLYPAATYWTCPVPPIALSVPSISHVTSNSTDNGSKGQEANSTALGKHSRNDVMQNDQETLHISSIPKTMRISDPQEAVNSSIWSMINHKNGKADASKVVGLFSSFQVDMKNHAMEGSQLLHSNPAALARSLCFQER